jgi:hypothetical protein
MNNWTKDKQIIDLQANKFLNYNRTDPQIQQSQIHLQKALTIVSHAFCYQKEKWINHIFSTCFMLWEKDKMKKKK